MIDGLGISDVNLIQAGLFGAQILPALAFSIFKEKRFVTRSKMFAYGIMTIVFAINLFYIPLTDSNVRDSLFWFALGGIFLVLLAFYTKESKHMFFGFKTVAAFEIPIVLYMYGVVTEWKWVLPLCIVLFVAFHYYSYRIRKEGDETRGGI
jgi:hypothetical protein